MWNTADRYCCCGEKRKGGRVVPFLGVFWSHFILMWLGAIWHFNQGDISYACNTYLGTGNRTLTLVFFPSSMCHCRSNLVGTDGGAEKNHGYTFSEFWVRGQMTSISRLLWMDFLRIKPIPSSFRVVAIGCFPVLNKSPWNQTPRLHMLSKMNMLFWIILKSILSTVQLLLTVQVPG